MASTIYLLEHNQRITQEIVNTSIKNGFEIFIFKKFADILIDLKRHRPNSILINAKLLPESYDEFLSINNFNIVVYGENIPLDRKLNLYEMGVSRVLELPYFQPGKLIQNLANQEMRTRMELEERVINLSDLNAVSQQKIKQLEGELSQEKADYQRTYQGFNQQITELKQQLETVTKLKERLEQDLGEALISQSK